MTKGGRPTCGHPRDVGVVTGGRRSGWNHEGNASERVAGEDLGEDDPDMWALSTSDGGAITGGRLARRKTASEAFPF
jgi:hypothetical protein